MIKSEMINRLNRFLTLPFVQTYGFLICILILALVLRIYNLTYGLPLLLYEDEPIYLYRVLPFGHGAWDPDYFKKPSFFLYFYFVFYYLYYLFGSFQSWAHFVGEFLRDPSTITLIGRLISVCFSVISVGLVYRIGLSFSRWVAIGAALLFALDQTHVFYTPRVVSDIPSLCCLLLTAVFALNVYRQGRFKDYLWTGVALGLTFSFKYNVLSVLFLLMAHGFRVLQNEQSSPWPVQLKQLGCDRKLWLGLLTAVGLFLVLNPFVVLNYSRFHEHLAFERRHMLLRDPSSHQAHWHWMVAFPQLCGRIMPKAMGWPLYVLSLVSLFGVISSAVFRYRQRQSLLTEPWLITGILSAFPLCFLVVLMQFQFLNAKYLLPILPFSYLLVAFSLERLVCFLYQKIVNASYLHFALKVTTMSLLLVFVSFPMVSKTLKLLNQYHRVDTRLTARQMITKLARSGDSIYVEADSVPLSQWHVLEGSALVLERHNKQFQVKAAGKGNIFFQKMLTSPHSLGLAKSPLYVIFSVPLNAEGKQLLSDHLNALSTHYKIQQIVSPFRTCGDYVSVDSQNTSHISMMKTVEKLIQPAKKALLPGPLLVLMKKTSST